MYAGQSSPASPIRRVGHVVAIALVLLALTPVPAARAALSPDDFESCLLDLINEDRAANGRSTLGLAGEMTEGLRNWSEWMRHNEFRHMTPSERNPILPDGVSGWGENIAWHSSQSLSDCSTIHNMLMNSAGHRANILNSSFTKVGLGTYVDGSGWWVTELFISCSGTFCDDDNSIFESDIESVAAAGITRGCNPPSNSMFCPDAYVTRGAMAAFLARALELPTDGSVDFIDDNGSIFENDIERIAAAGITRGCNPPTNTMYCPDSYVTRGEMAAFLSRALNLPDNNSVDFIDDDGSLFESDIEKMAGAGITQGCNPPANDRFCPNSYVTRGAMAAFLARALDL